MRSPPIFQAMPTYDYLCEQCGKQFEVFQSMKDAKLETCEDCGGKVRRLLGTGAGLIFKGSGFYQTDYRSKSYQEGAKKDKPSEGGKEGGKKDTKTKEPAAAPKAGGGAAGKAD